MKSPLSSNSTSAFNPTTTEGGRCRRAWRWLLRNGVVVALASLFAMTIIFLIDQFSRVHTDIAELERTIGDDIDTLRKDIGDEVRSETLNLRTEARADVRSLRTEIQATRSEVLAEIRSLRTQ